MGGGGGGGEIKHLFQINLLFYWFISQPNLIVNYFNYPPLIPN